MRVLCVVSEQPGHLDFGGMGYLRVAEQLRSRGHDIRWIVNGDQAKRIQAEQFQAIEDINITDLHLNRLIEHLAKGTPLANTIQTIEHLANTCSRLTPDIVLCDRVLSFAPLALEQTGAPYVSMGTPGGEWRVTRNGVIPATTPISQYLVIGEEIRRRLAFPIGTLPSAWVNSPWLNICFVGRSYGDISHTRLSSASFVRHFAAVPPECRTPHVGCSFGNTGDPRSLLNVLQILANERAVTLDVFMGRRREVRDLIDGRFTGELVRLHEWVDFNDFLPKLTLLLFLGGISTLWDCVNYCVPMAIVPGGSGDQYYNSRAVHTLGLGVAVDGSLLDQSLVLKLAKSVQGELLSPYFDHFRSPSNYTDTLDTVCERLEALPL
jgi:UDP:flavonoid glycosyltransferase YjiC (YdhE family)